MADRKNLPQHRDRLTASHQKLFTEAMLLYHQVPFGNIRVAEKDVDGNVTLSNIYMHREDSIDRNAAFQPILEALQIGPSVFALGRDRVLITEGLYDFFAFNLMKPDDSFAILPAVGAHSITYLISLQIAWGSDYFAVWDNDREGRNAMNLAKEHFGTPEADRHFRLLPIPSGSRARKRIMQDLFHNSDIKMLKDSLGLPNNVSFKKVLLAWHYSEERDDLRAQISPQTESSFCEVFEELWPVPVG